MLCPALTFRTPQPVQHLSDRTAKRDRVASHTKVDI